MNEFKRGFVWGAIAVATWIGRPVAEATMRHPVVMGLCYSLPALIFCIWFGAQIGDWSVAGAAKFLAAYWMSATLIQLAARPAHCWLAKH